MKLVYYLNNYMWLIYVGYNHTIHKEPEVYIKIFICISYYFSTALTYPVVECTINITPQHVGTFYFTCDVIDISGFQ